MNRCRSQTAVLAGLLAVGLGDGCAAPVAQASEPPAVQDPRIDSTNPAELLRLARQDLEAGETLRAREALARVSREYPVIADYADLFAAESLLAEGDFDAAEQWLASARARHEKSPLRLDFQKHHGRALRELGDDAEARRAWLALLSKRSYPRSEKAELWAQVARSHLREGDPDLAWDAYMEIWRQFPDQGESAQEASTWLDAYEAAGSEKRTSVEWRDRADQLFRNRDLEAALQAYDHALQMNPSAATERITRKRRADALFNLKRYEEAERAYARYGGSAVIGHSRALALARSGRVQEAVDQLLKHANKPGVLKKSIYRAKYTAALLLEGEGRDDEARKLFEAVARDAGRSHLRPAALWHIGWDDYRAGRYSDAVHEFEKLAEIELHPVSTLRPRYWRARALENLGDPRAEAELRSIAAEFPLSYYGWRASQRAGSGETSAEGTASVATAPAATSRTVDRARILLEADLNEAALAELRRSLPGPASTLSERVAHAALAQAAGAYNLAQASVLRGNAELLARGPQRHAEDVWWHAWPRAYASEVDVAVARVHGRVAPELVFAIIREESGYRPQVISAVGARGLMQIMEPTGQQLARARGMDPIEAADLFDPALNIELGTQYLADLTVAFPGHLAAAIASYNAGPHVVQQWPGLEELEEDEWVETIPYAQTQKYVKRVLRSRRAYGSLYADD